MLMATTPDSNDGVTAPEHHGDGRAELRLVSGSQATDPRFIEKWQALAAEVSEPNPFFEPWCLIPAMKHLHGGAKLALLSYVVDGRLRGLMPIERASRYYGYRVPHAAIWLHDNAFCSTPLVAAGYEQDFWHAVLAKLDAKPKGALFLHLPQLCEDGPMANALETVAERDGRLCRTVKRSERAMLAPDTSDPEAYLEQAMSAKKRKELRRQYKRLSEQGELLLERREDATKLAEWTAQFLALEAEGWKGEAGSALSSADGTRRFFKETLQRAAKAGRLERLALQLDGRPIAMLASFVTSPGVFSFKTTFDEAFARFSPGLLLQIENLAMLERGDIAWADSCAAEGHSMIERIWREKRTMVSRNVAIGGGVRRFVCKQMMAYEMRGSSKS